MKQSKGYTLIELLVAIAIVTALALISNAVLAQDYDCITDTECEQQYYNHYGAYDTGVYDTHVILNRPQDSMELLLESQERSNRAQERANTQLESLHDEYRHQELLNELKKLNNAR